MPVFVRPLLAQEREEALLFIEPYEAECVNLAAQIIAGAPCCWAVYYAEQVSGNENEREPKLQDCRISRNICARGQTRANSGTGMQGGGGGKNESEKRLQDQNAGGQKLAGLLALKKKRSLFHCLPFAKYKTSFDKKICNEAQRPLAEFFEANEPFCVNGEAAGGLFIKNILRHKKTPLIPSAVNEYFLMVSGAENEREPKLQERRMSRNIRARGQTRANSGNGLQGKNSGAENENRLQAQEAAARADGLFEGARFFRATPQDCERLLPLELAYQREEVVPPSFDISDQALAAAFKESLLDNNTFALECKGAAVSKARITSRGRSFAMIGGVFTKESERKKGWARLLVQRMMDEERSQGVRHFCLYAKKNNAAALALYKSLGFEERGGYLLLYY